MQTSEPVCAVGRDGKWRHHLEKSRRVFRKFSIGPAVRLAAPLSVRSQRNRNQVSERHPHPVFTAALFTVAKTWKLSNCPLTDKWMKETWCTHNGALFCEKSMHDATWVDAEDVTLSEVNWTQKDAYCRPHLKSVVLAGGRGGGRAGVAPGRSSSCAA